MLAAVVIGGIVLPVAFQRRAEIGQRAVDVRPGGIEIDDQRRNLGAQKMVRAAGAERCQLLHVVGADELHHRVGIVEMAQHRDILGYHAANGGHQNRSDPAAFAGRQGLVLFAAKHRLAGGFLLEPGNGAVDGVNGGIVALFCRIAPGKQAVAGKNDALGAGVVLAEF